VFWGEFTRRSPEAHRANVEALMALYGEGRIRPAVTARFSLAQGAEAIARLEAREARGKMVITMAGKP
jgi:NADPH:quinone reductase